LLPQPTIELKAHSPAWYCSIFTNLEETFSSKTKRRKVGDGDKEAGQATGLAKLEAQRAQLHIPPCILGSGP